MAARHIKSGLFTQTLEAPVGLHAAAEGSLGGTEEEKQAILFNEAPPSSPSGGLPSAPIHVRTHTEDVTVKLIIYMIGFSEGLTHLAALAIYYLLKDDLGLGPAGTSALFVLPSLPWFLKPLLAFLSDTTPIFGMRRKPYLIVFSLVETLGYLLLAEYPDDVISVSVGLLIIALGAAFCSAICEALVVETSSQSVNAANAASSNVSELIGAKAVGSLVVAYLSGALLEIYTKRSVFRVTAMFPLMITVAACAMRDTGETPILSPMDQFKALEHFLSQRAIWGPAVFILLFMGGPDYDDALFYFYTVVLRFSPSFMGSLRFTYGIAALVGLALYNWILKDVSYRQTLLYTILIAFPVYISPIILVSGRNRDLGISDEVFVLSGGFLIEAVAELQLIPLLVFTALICPPGLEASVYSIMMSIRNLGSALGKGSSAVAIRALAITADNFDHLVELIWICGVFTLIPLSVIYLIPSAEEMANLRAANLRKHRLSSESLSDDQHVWAKVADKMEAKFQHHSTSSSSPSSHAVADTGAPL